jgi:hypothetical protein
MKKLLFAFLALFFVASAAIAAADDASWLHINGDYRFRYDMLEGRVHDYVQADPTGANPLGTPIQGYTLTNNSLMLNRFGLDLRADALEEVTVKARLVMYKVWGQETSSVALDNTFADRFGTANDGTSGHVPEDNTLRVDYAYATVANLFDAPAWFSIGRRPSTGGIPGNLRQNREKIGTAGIPDIMVDYAFDGMTLGYAPDIEALPGAFVKLCYGKGFDSGFMSSEKSTYTKDTDFFGVNAALADTETGHVELQYQRGSHIFDKPSDTPPTTNLGDIDWYGGVILGKMGDLNLFLSAARSKTDPNGRLSDGMAGLLFNAGDPAVSRTGYAVYIGGRYDIPSSGTKLGAEYNKGSEYWVGMVPAGDDIWTSKLGTRGSVYEVYLIQELKRKPISNRGKAFFRLGYQYYIFDYTGSNNWVGAPVAMADLSTTNSATQQMLAPIKDAKDIYLTFDVLF